MPGAFCDEATNLCTRIDNVPTLSEWGLISMAAILGLVGFMVIRRRKATA
ncbi:MAG: IPTL-CTERM sorting domain-containing protein [Deltaproteobacteria bacterium]|nr:IPTL-CTERM sorting domain-containing protein [Deltaproteobacteria bacterium]